MSNTEGKFGRDLTTGSIPRHLLLFSMPMLIGNLLQTGYSIVNILWLKVFLGDNAVAATAISFPILFILIAVAAGATMATTVLVSQYYGAKNNEMVEKVVNTSFTIALVLGVVLTIISILSSNLLLKLINTPPEIFDLASGYLKVFLISFALMFMYFLITSILRGIGDSMTPLIFLLVAVVLNALLDPLLIGGIWIFPKLGLTGAAIATIISNAVSFLAALVYLNRKKHIISFNPKKLTFDKDIAVMIFKIGFPSMIQQSLVSFSMFFITGFVNAFGAPATAAFGAAGRIDNIAFMPAMSLGMAASTLTGQNLGAKKAERVADVFKWGVILSSSITILVSVLAVAFPRLILAQFLTEKTALDIGVEYLRIVGSSYIFFAVMFISNGIINGAGHTMTTMIFTIVSLWVIRVPAAWLLSKYTTLGITGIWMAMALSFGCTAAISVIYYFSGRWKKEVIRKWA